MRKDLKECYSLLHVKPTASTEEVERAYISAEVKNYSNEQTIAELRFARDTILELRMVEEKKRSDLERAIAEEIRITALAKDTAIQRYGKGLLCYLGGVTAASAFTGYLLGPDTAENMMKGAAAGITAGTGTALLFYARCVRKIKNDLSKKS
jgi:hypothetical protein